MKLWLRLGIREIRANRRFSLFFVLNLSMGLLGFMALTSFNHSFHRYLGDHLKEILTADMVVSANRPLGDKELSAVARVLGPDRRESRQVRFYSMISAGDVSRLARIVAVDDAYPLYGTLILEKKSPAGLGAKDAGKTKASDDGGYSGETQSVGAASRNKPGGRSSGAHGQEENRGLQEKPAVWMSPDLAVSLGLDVGDSVRIGRMVFEVDNLILSAPDKAATSIELAPTVYMGLGQLERTGLVRFGSRVRYYRHYRLPENADAGALTLSLRREMERLFEGAPPVSVYNSLDVNRSLGRLFGYFTGYMGLVGIVAVFLAGIGAAYLFRDYLNAKLKEIAILMSLGADRFHAGFLFMVQVVLLGMGAALIAILLSFFLLPVFPVLLSGIVPGDFKPAMDMGAILPALVLGTLGSVVFCLPVFVRIRGLKPVVLLREKELPAGGFKAALMQASGLLPGFLLFWGLSVWQAGSLGRGTVFWGGFSGVMAIMWGIGTVLLAWLRKRPATGNPIRKIAFRNLYRNRTATIACFVVIAMGAFLINLIPQLKNGIQDEIGRPDGMIVPDYFLIDIQPEQARPLVNFLKDRNTPLSNLSPMVRGRITGVNGRGLYERISEKRKTGRGRRPYRRREFNFSYRAESDLSETIVKGRPLTDVPWDFSGDTPMEVSLEEGFAERFDLSIGDLMAFDIQGIPLTGKVVNFRKVRWNSFQPNFFILFQKGVLDDAPKTFLASISRVGRGPALQNALAKAFPNISVLDVSRTVGEMLDITDRLSFGINFMALLAMVTGLLVVYSIARNETRGRLWEINLLKVLGADSGDLRRIVMLEFGALGFTAALLATLAALGASYGISFLFFDRLWSFRWGYALFGILSVTLVCTATAAFAAGKAARGKASDLLRSV